MNTKVQRSTAVYQKMVEALLAEYASVDDAVLNMSAIDGGWSVIQIMHHLLLTEELSLRYVRKKLSFQPDLKPAGWEARLKSALLKFYLSVPFKFKAPDVVGEDNLPGFTSFTDTRNRWLNIRKEWTGFLDQLPPELLDKAVYRHPLAGRLSWTGSLAFFRYHFQRHKKQIERTLGQRK